MLKWDVGCEMTDVCRRLLLFPRGNDNQRTADYVAVYLDFPEATFTPVQICPKAHFELMAVNQANEQESLRRGL